MGDIWLKQAYRVSEGLTTGRFLYPVTAWARAWAKGSYALKFSLAAEDLIMKTEKSMLRKIQ